MNVPWFSVDQSSVFLFHDFSKQAIPRLVISLETKYTIHCANIILCRIISSLEMPKALIVHSLTIRVWLLCSLQCDGPKF